MSAQNVALPETNTQSSLRLPFGGRSLRFAAVAYLSVMILVPLIVIAIEGVREGIDLLWVNVTRPQALGAIWLSIWTAAVMALINIVMGTLTAYVLTAYSFHGKRLINAIIDLPFAIPTLVTGVMLVLLYGPQTAIGGLFETTFGSRFMYAPPGMILALLFLGYPFVTRAVQPVLAGLDIYQQEAAQTLGASGWTTFRRVIAPAIIPAIITGGMLSFARALGEFGAIVIVSGNIPLRTQTAAVYIYGQIESGNPTAATSVSLVMLAIALGTTLIAERWVRRYGHD
jgi:sulfate/thiosulfate transport system permease protein